MLREDNILRRLAVLALAGGVMMSPAAMVWAEEGGDVWPLTLALSEDSLHSLVMRSSGPTTAMAWVESSYDGPDALHFLEIGDGPLAEIPEPGSLDLPAGSFVLNPDLDVHPATGAPAFTWVGEEADGSRVYFAMPGEPAQVVYSSGGSVEFPVIKFDGEGAAHLAWFENVGIHSRVFLARGEADGEWTILPVSEQERPHDLLPQLFRQDVGVELYWFSVMGGETVTRRGVFTGAMLERSASPFEQVPPNRWPMLYRPGTAETLGAMWLEQTGEGEVYFDLDPRIDPPGSPNALGTGAVKVSQVSVSEDPWAAKSWIESTADATASLYAVRPGRDVEVRLEPSAPVVESTVSASQGWLNLLWVEDDRESGLLLLRFHREN